MSGKTKKKIIGNRWLHLTLALCAAVVVYLCLAHIDLFFKGLGGFFGFISPVIIGIIIAYVLDPLARIFEKYIFRGLKKESTRRRLSVALTVAAVLLFLVLLLVVLIPQLFSSISYFVRHLDTYVEQLQNLVNDIAGKSAAKKINIDRLTNAGSDLLSKISSGITGNVDDIVNTSLSVGTGLFNFIISFILAIYFLLDKKHLLAGCRRLMKAALSDKSYKKTTDFLNRCNNILIRYIACDIFDGIIIGVINFVFMCIAGYQYGGLISIIVGVTNLAPTFGPIVGCAIGAFILLLVNPWHALVFILFTIALQTFDGYIFTPKLFGNTLGVSSIWILICIIVGGRMFGVWGILLAIPFAAIFDFVYHEMIITLIESRKAKKAKESGDDSGVGDTVRADDQTSHIRPDDSAGTDSVKSLPVHPDGDNV